MIGIRQALGLSGLRVAVATVLGLISTMVISRLLSPQEVGVFSLAAGLLSLISSLRDLGVANYVVREPDLSAEKLGTCFSFTLIAAWSIGAIVALAATPLAVAFAAPGLSAVLWVMALGLFVIPFNSLHLALLRRERRFDKLLYIDLASALAYSMTAIGLALAGASFMALAWAGFVALLATILTTRLVAAPLRPIVPSLAEWRSVASFGGNSLALTLVTTISNAVPEVIVGKALGLHDVGILSRAQGFLRPLIQLVATAVEPVVFSAAASKHRAGAALGTDYLHAARFLSVLAWPVFGFMIVMAEPLIRVLFGPGWEDSATVLAWIAINGLSLPIFAFNGSFLTTVGELRTHLRVQSGAAAFKIGAWLLVFNYDLTTAVKAFVAVHIVHVAVSMLMVCRHLGLTPAALLVAVMPAVPISAAALTLPIMLSNLGVGDSMAAITLLCIGAAASATLWLVAVIVLDHPIKHELRRVLTRLQRTRPVTP